MIDEKELEWPPRDQAVRKSEILRILNLRKQYSVKRDAEQVASYEARLQEWQNGLQDRLISEIPSIINGTSKWANSTRYMSEDPLGFLRPPERHYSFIDQTIQLYDSAIIIVEAIGYEWFSAELYAALHRVVLL